MGRVRVWRSPPGCAPAYNVTFGYDVKQITIGCLVSASLQHFCLKFQVLTRPGRSDRDILIYIPPKSICLNFCGCSSPVTQNRFDIVPLCAGANVGCILAASLRDRMCCRGCLTRVIMMTRPHVHVYKHCCCVASLNDPLMSAVGVHPSAVRGNAPWTMDSC